MRRIALACITVGVLGLAAWLAQAEPPSTIGAPAPGDAGADALVPSDGPPGAGFAPDPPPLVTRQQWVVDLLYSEGQVTMREARRLTLERPTATPRMMGRFALELYVGPRLLDRVRFDFPMLGAGEYEAKPVWNSPPSFEHHATSSAAVMIPNSERATRLTLLDRASGKTWKLPWPPAKQ
jgi:hypothetical protein